MVGATDPVADFHAMSQGPEWVRNIKHTANAVCK